MNLSTKIILVLLRLAIGWHFLFEGMEKLNDPSWTSAGYLRESTGPLAPTFRKLAGDPVIDRMAVLPAAPGEDPGKGDLPKKLAVEWQAYVDSFVKYYQLDEAQTQKAQETFAKSQEETLLWLRGQKKLYKPSPEGQVLEKVITPERLADYTDKVKQLEETESGELSMYTAGAKAKHKNLKADVAKLRSELLGDLAEQTTRMKNVVGKVLTEEQQKLPPMPEPVRPGLRSGGLLGWSDFIVRYGLTAVGLCLLAGFFTRSACIGGAIFLLMFYLAMPALPWLPESLRAEGHYVLINKNIIEMAALLALACTPSGQWVGLDGLIQALRLRRRKAKPAVPTYDMKTELNLKVPPTLHKQEESVDSLFPLPKREAPDGD